WSLYPIRWRTAPHSCGAWQTRNCWVATTFSIIPTRGDRHLSEATPGRNGRSCSRSDGYRRLPGGEPGSSQGCPGNDRLVVAARQAPPRFSGILLVDETQNGELGVRYQNTVLSDLLKVLPRRRFAASVERHKGDKYIKGFSSWDHLVTLICAQLGRLSRLREVQAVWNAQAVHHYHLGTGPIRRSTLSDANRRRPSAIFAETFAALSELAEGALPRHGSEILRLIDATPIPLTSLH